MTNPKVAHSLALVEDLKSVFVSKGSQKCCNIGGESFLGSS